MGTPRSTREEQAEAVIDRLYEEYPDTTISLRCAIYRLLAEGIEGSAPMPPLILDEPTVFLDAGHVSRLVDLVGEMRSLGVTQILIVSHDDELVAAADDLVTVEKDPTTNRSSVRRREDVSLPTVELGADD